MHYKGSYWLVINTPQSLKRQLNGTLHLVSQIVNEKLSRFFESKWIFFNKVKLLDENVAKQSQSSQVLVKKIRLFKVKDQKLRGLYC